MVMAALPAARRLVFPPEGASWRLDGAGIPLKTSVILGMLVVYLAGLILLGLEVSSFGFLLGSLYYLGHRQPSRLFLIPFLVTGIMWAMFKYFLQVYFPTPLLIEWFTG